MGASCGVKDVTTFEKVVMGDETDKGEEAEADEADDAEILLF